MEMSTSTSSSTGQNSTSKEVKDDQELEPSPMWEKGNDGWELTWPIWHMLPRDERKALAERHGYKTIGEFEEYMSLQQAVDNSELIRPYRNNMLYDADEEDGTDRKMPAVEAKTATPKKTESQHDEESDSESEPDYEKQASAISDELSGDELFEVAGMILKIPEEILHKAFSYLPVDAYASLALVSPHWKHLTRTEAVYKRLCERLYLNQSKKKQLHVSRFGNSYRKMLEIRPRVRAAGGCYVLKYAQVKKIQRDMWTEIPVGAILETVYYRYMYFQEDGRVLYALTSASPHLMFPRLVRVCLEKRDDPAAVWGTYEVQKNSLTVAAKQAWTNVKFELTIEQDSPHGRFGALRLDKHSTSARGCFESWSDDLVVYDVPTEQFRFLKDRRL